MGKAAEAMKQFDLAVKVDRDDPHAYNLISEALLRKGLYRSALPILRRAAALQPNDGRIAQWIEQTKQALSGGSAPVLYDSTTVDVKALAEHSLPTTSEGASSSPVLPAEAGPPFEANPESDVFAAFAPAKPDSDSPTVVMTPHGLGGPERAQTTGELPVIAGTIEEPGSSEPPLSGGTLEPPDPFAAVTSNRTDSDTLRGLTSTFDALSEGASPEAPARPRFPDFQAGPSVVVAIPDSVPPPPVAGPPVRSSFAPESAAARVLDDVLSAQSELPTSEFQLPGAGQGAPIYGSSGGLLGEIPDESPESPPARGAASTHHNTQATEAIAKEYERELRAKLEVNKQKKTFWQAHGLKIALIAGAVVVLGRLGGSFATRGPRQGETLTPRSKRGA